MRITITILLAFALVFISGTTKRTVPATSPIDGAWELVWSKRDGKVTTTGKPLQFKMFHNGFFSTIMQDSTGKWTIAAAGTFETNGNVYKETFRYSSMADIMGYTGWQQFELKGDTLYKTLYSKVVDASGKEITPWVKGLEEKRVRAKQP